MGAQMQGLLALSVLAGLLALVVGSSPPETRWAAVASFAFRLCGLCLFASYVGWHASREIGPFSPGLNFALMSSLSALGGWHAWEFLAGGPEGDAEEEPGDDDANWF